VRAAQEEAEEAQQTKLGLVGEDAAAFDVSQQSTKSWALFTGLLTGVLGLLYVVGECG